MHSATTTLQPYHRHDRDRLELSPSSGIDDYSCILSSNSRNQNQDGAHTTTNTKPRHHRAHHCQYFSCLDTDPYYYILLLQEIPDPIEYPYFLCFFRESLRQCCGTHGKRCGCVSQWCCLSVSGFLARDVSLTVCSSVKKCVLMST